MQPNAKELKYREVVTHEGETFLVPQGIQRIDTRSTHGWQVRYQGTKMFSDGDIGARKALFLATDELADRMLSLPAPVLLQRAPSANKTSDLPPGISGPIMVPPRRGSRVRSAVLSVLLPRYGQDPRVKSIYIGTERTYTESRFEEALAKAIEMRAEVVKKYEATATRVKRQQGQALKAQMRATREARKAHA